MKHQIISDRAGIWAVVFDRSPFCHGELSSDERREIKEALAQYNLVRDEQRPDTVTHSGIQVRVLEGG